MIIPDMCLHVVDGDFSRALEIFTTAGLRTTKPYISKILIGNNFYKESQYLKALHAYSAAVRCLEGNVDQRCRIIALFNRSIAYFRVGDDQKGFKDIGTVVEIDKDNKRALALYTLGDCFISSSNS